MTLADFIAARREVDDLNVATPDTYVSNKKAPGYVYPGGLVIEKVTDAWTTRHRVRYCLTIGNRQRLDFDLAPLERDLFEYGQDEGIVP